MTIKMTHRTCQSKKFKVHQLPRSTKLQVIFSLSLLTWERQRQPSNRTWHVSWKRQSTLSKQQTWTTKSGQSTTSSKWRNALHSKTKENWTIARLLSGKWTVRSPQLISLNARSRSEKYFAWSLNSKRATLKTTKMVRILFRWSS